MTIAEIAAYARVSTGTVDRVIHKRGNVAEKTQKKIESIIDEFGYQPNPLARQLKKNKKFIIGLLLPSLDSGASYWKQVYSGIAQAENRLEPFLVETLSRPFNRLTEGDALKNARLLKEKNIDALITAPVSPTEFAEIIQVLEHTPYVFIDSPLSPSLPIATLAQPPYQAGQCAGKIIKMLKGSGTYASIRMFANAYNLRERHRGFVDYISQDSASVVIEGICSEMTETGVSAFLDDLLALHPSIHGIFIPHAETYLFAQALVEKGLKSNIALVGYDLMEENRQKLLEGSIDCLIDQRPQYQGLTAVYELYQTCILHQKAGGKINIPIDIYYRENVIL